MFVDVAGTTARYEKIGSGPPVVILHGWGGSVETVRPIVQCLARDHTAFAVDLPGFGRTPQPTAVWGVFEYARWVADFMDAVGCADAHFVGHSFGGRVAIGVAVRHPHRLNRLVLVDSAGIKPERTWRYHLRVRGFKAGRALLGLAPVPRWRQAALDSLRRAFGSTDYRDAGTMRESFVRVVNEDLRGLLPSIQAPCMLIWGENDPDVPVSDGRIMAREIPGARLHVLPGAGHFSYLDRLPQFCQLVRDFLLEKGD
jgi:pimeloyl-ACP methyl ester carboxylesterase